MIVGVRNLGSEALNVSLVGGSVNLVQSFGNYMQNLTIQPYNWPVPAGEEMSFPYMFQLDPRLGSVKYQGAQRAPVPSPVPSAHPSPAQWRSPAFTPAPAPTGS